MAEELRLLIRAAFTAETSFIHFVESIGMLTHERVDSAGETGLGEAPWSCVAASRRISVVRRVEDCPSSSPC